MSDTLQIKFSDDFLVGGAAGANGDRARREPAVVLHRDVRLAKRPRSTRSSSGTASPAAAVFVPVILFCFFFLFCFLIEFDRAEEQSWNRHNESLSLQVI